MAGLPFDPELAQEPPGSDLRSLPMGSQGGMGASPAQGALDQLLERNLRAQESPWHRFWSGFGGVDLTKEAASLIQLQQGQQGLGIREQELGVSQGNLALNQRQLEEHMKQFLVTKQLAVGTLVHGFIRDLAAYPMSQRGEAGKIIKGFLGPLLKEVGIPVPENVLGAMTTSPATSVLYPALVRKYFGTEPERIAEIHALLSNAKDVKEVETTLKTLFSLERDVAVPAVQKVLEQYTRALRSSDKGAQARMGLLSPEGKPLPIPGALLINQFDSVFKAITGKDPTPAEQAAGASILSDDKGGFLASIGVMPGAIASEDMKILAKSAAELRTPQGRADLEGKQAETRRKEFMAVPGQGGAIIRLPGIGGGGGGATAAPTPEGGLTTAPGVGILAQSPGPPMSPEASKQLVNLEQSLAKLEQLNALVKHGDVNKYLGPGTSRPFSATWEWMQKNLPAAVVGNIPEGLSDLEQMAAVVKNIQIVTRTGAAVRETEEPRLLAELPDRTKDKPPVFKRKLSQSLDNARVLVKRYRELVGPDGRLKSGADPEAVAKKYPLSSTPLPKGYRAE